MIEIVKVTRNELEPISILFDLYRQFYGQHSDIDAATAFISQRLILDDSTILLAINHDGKEMGFVQLYPSFASVAMKPIWILNDLFVIPSSRKSGVGEALLNAAQTLAKNTGAVTVKLATAVDNHAAKSLYESIGYQKITAFDHYTRPVSSA